MRILALGLALLLASAALAHEGATGIVKERMEHMKSIAASTKQVGKMLKGETEFDAALLRQAALEIGNHGGSSMTGLFPNGSLDHPSEALPSIWQEWDRFEELAAELSAQASILAEAASNGPKNDAVVAAFERVAATCRDCHQDFRIAK